uniref:Tc1-like transposase DDE domain-containing protein n=1 Tax=Octopus bimaculoides TaxID=37653 RepID=A0A0L8GW37_OCTBM
MFFLPPYSPFLNPIENIFSVWKHSVIQGEAKNEPELYQLISEKFDEITPEHYDSFYQKMLRCVDLSEQAEIILSLFFAYA